MIPTLAVCSAFFLLGIMSDYLFGRPAVKPRYERGIIHTWWYDPEKAAKLKTN
jgi:hypothetical protein